MTQESREQALKEAISIVTPHLQVDIDNLTSSTERFVASVKTYLENPAQSTANIQLDTLQMVAGFHLNKYARIAKYLEVLQKALERDQLPEENRHGVDTN